jgi:hypothetical protein
MAEPADITHLDVLLEAAVKQGRVEVVTAMLADGRANVSPWSLYRACFDGNADIVTLLLADGRIDNRVVHSVALQTSTGRGHVDVVATLLADGRADPAADDSYALWVSAQLPDAAGVAARLVCMFLADGRADPVKACASFGIAPLLQPATRWWQRRAWLRAGAGAGAGGWKNALNVY